VEAAWQGRDPQRTEYRYARIRTRPEVTTTTASGRSLLNLQQNGAVGNFDRLRPPGFAGISSGHICGEMSTKVFPAQTA
jgi:hypothetical protein